MTTIDENGVPQFEVPTGKPYIYPIDPEARNDILSIDRMTKQELRVKHHSFINSDWEANTIATVFVEVMIKSLNSQINNEGIRILDESYNNVLNFYDMLLIAATSKRNESAEKIGNINVKFMPGRLVDEIISRDYDKEPEFITPEAAYTIEEDEALTSAMLKLDSIVRNILQEKYAIVCPYPWQTVAVTYIFIESLYRTLVQKLVSSGQKKVMINFNEYIEFNASMKDEKVTVSLHPGMAAKLIIKDDGVTEADDE